MNNALITFSFAGLPAGYCYTSPERFALDIAAGLQGYLPGDYSTLIKSSTEPLAIDRDKVWVQINADGAMTGRVFTFAYGKWVMLNTRRDEHERVWWTGTESQAWSYDGGDGTNPTSNPPTATTGAMWMRDTDYDARFPIQVGTLPQSGTVLIPGDTGGEEEHTQTIAEMPEHAHDIIGNPLGGANQPVKVVIDDDVMAPTNTKQTESVGGGEAMSFMPPYRAGMWLRPTSRLFYTS